MMKKLCQTLLLVLSSLLLLISIAVSAQAQGYFVEGQIRWKKEMGVLPNGPGNDYPVAHPCGFFNVAALDAHSQKPVTYTDQVKLPFQKTEEEGYYVCRYSLAVPTDRDLYILATMGGLGLLPKEDRDPWLITNPWLGGSRSTPPAGYERGFTGHKYINLRSRVTKKKVVWIVNFELIYISDGPK
jgi:hypothetical protein